MQSCQATKTLSPQEQIYLPRGSGWTLTRSWYSIWLIFSEKATADFREASERRPATSSQTNRANKHFSARSQHLQLESRNRLQRWHIITLQEASECVDHDILTSRFQLTHCAGCAILHNKDTFYPNIDVKSIYLHDTRRDLPDQVMEGEQGWVMQGVLSRASFRRSPVSGQKSFTVLSLHISNVHAKKKGIAKKLILTLRAIIIRCR